MPFLFQLNKIKKKFKKVNRSPFCNCQDSMFRLCYIKQVQGKVKKIIQSESKRKVELAI